MFEILKKSFLSRPYYNDSFAANANPSLFLYANLPTINPWDQNPSVSYSPENNILHFQIGIRVQGLYFYNSICSTVLQIPGYLPSHPTSSVLKDYK